MHTPAAAKSSETTTATSGSGYQRVRTQTEGGDDTGGDSGTAVEMHEDEDNLVIVDHHHRRTSSHSHRVLHSSGSDDDEYYDGTTLSPSASQQEQATTPQPQSPNSSAMKRISSFRRGDSAVSASNDLEMIAQTVSNAVASAVSAGQGGGKGYKQVNQQAPLSSPLPSQQPSSSPKKSALHNRSRNNSWDNVSADVMVMMDGTVLSLDDDLFEDDAVVRRYIRSRIPIVPAEFSHQPLHIRLWQGLQELRTAARQRRAARLLNDSQYTPTSHCLLTWFCDATDRGIALVAILILLWLVVGFIGTPSTGYWIMGFILFVFRISARSTYEAFLRNGGLGGSIHGRRRSLPVSTSSAAAGVAVTVDMNDYRDNA